MTWARERRNKTKKWARDLDNKQNGLVPKKHMINCWISLCVFVAQSCPTLCDPTDCSLPGILQARTPGMGCYSLLQRTFLTQGSNCGLLHCRQIIYGLSWISLVMKLKLQWNTMTWSEWPKLKTLLITMCCQGCGTSRMLIHCW